MGHKSAGSKQQELEQVIKTALLSTQVVDGHMVKELTCNKDTIVYLTTTHGAVLKAY